MHIRFFVEEPSAEAALNHLLPRMLSQDISFDIQVFQGKDNLLQQLPLRLRALSAWIPEDWRIMVLADRDDSDCRDLKRKLDDISVKAGLATRSMVKEGGFIQVINRIAIEELEAWFFGDIPALRETYPRLSQHLSSRERYRHPDAIAGGTWEALERELQQAGYYRGGLQKIAVARDVARHMNPDNNRSPSFQAFWRGLQELIGAL